jgi:AcrR family transcriptional regulator
MFRNYGQDVLTSTGFSVAHPLAPTSRPRRHAGAVPEPAARPARTGRPPATSRPEILAAARRLIDRDGWEKLTVRRLAGELGIGTTTLYHHVRNKEDLLLLLLNVYAEQIAQPTLPADPRERVVAAAIALHETLAAWPWAVEVLTTDGFVGLLAEPALLTVETIVAGAIDAGCTPEQAVEVFRSLWYYTVGEILVRAHSAPARANGTPRPSAGEFLGHVDASRLPRLAALGSQWPVVAARDTYAWGLGAFVDGLLAHVTSRTLSKGEGGGRR